MSEQEVRCDLIMKFHRTDNISTFIDDILDVAHVFFGKETGPHCSEFNLNGQVAFKWFGLSQLDAENFKTVLSQVQNPTNVSDVNITILHNSMWGGKLERKHNGGHAKGTTDAGVS